jgi:pimeloyl-ACP methyl ester carboxylesterase
VFKRMMAAMTPELRGRIEALEKAGLYGNGKDFEKNRYPTPYMVAAWGEGYFPCLYRRRPDANYDPSIARDMQRCIAGSQMVVLPESGHMTFVDQPAPFLKAVDDFVKTRP